MRLGIKGVGERVPLCKDTKESTPNGQNRRENSRPRKKGRMNRWVERRNMGEGGCMGVG